ncbi:MAG: alpha/beta hydrolase [Rhodobacterales bacterium]|nr:alpha/beta hydrolase [Rhodobacterales bacterium]
MTNDLIKARDAFSAASPETRQAVNSREWGVLQVGNSGPALVLLPGTLGRGDIFWNQITDLRNHARILSLTYPQSGSLQDWASDISTLMATHKFENSVILGSSLGGYVAQYFAATYPDQTKALIAANTLHSVAMLSELPPYNADLDTIPNDTLMQGFLDGLTQWAAEEPARTDLIDLLIAEVSGRIPVPELRSRLKALKNGPELPLIALKKQHIFTVDSGDDRLIPPPMRAAVRARLDPFRAAHFETGTHFPYLTHPADYSAMIANILGVKINGDHK